MRDFRRIGILGSGAWGTALGACLQREAIRAGDGPAREIRMWSREDEVAQAMSAGQGNPVFLPNVELPAIATSSDLASLEGCEAILAVVPAQFARSSFEQLAPYVADGTPVLLCAKGIERGSLSLMTDVLQETLPQAVPAVLSGPSFAIDVAKGLPTAVTLSCADEDMGEALMAAIGGPTFRPYLTTDLIGAEIGGAVKNVLAIACGIVDGLGLGKSAHAALIARGFAEMTRLGVALGGRPETLAGLCGLGDLVLTCSSPQSRNMSFGKALGEGQSAEAILASRNSVTEGVATAPAMVTVAARAGVEMPICKTVDQILNHGLTVPEAIETLMARPLKREEADAI